MNTTATLNLARYTHKPLDGRTKLEAAEGSVVADIHFLLLSVSIHSWPVLAFVGIMSIQSFNSFVTL